MKRFTRAWPPTPHEIKRRLKDVDLLPRQVQVTWTDHDIGRIKFHCKLPIKYAIVPDEERKQRTICAFSDRVLDCRTRQNQRWVSLSFVLDCSAWVNL